MRAWLWGVAVGRLRCNKPFDSRAAIVLAALSAAVVLGTPDLARAAGFFDLFFGGSPQYAPPAGVTPYAEPGVPARITEGEPQGAAGAAAGRSVTFCVRLCDGQHFPLEHTVYATPVETCRAMCPASKTKVFFGSAIDHASARDGQRYTDLDNAYVYRDHLVPNCTCNGKDAFGLAPLDAKSDPTLRPGDIVSTKDGLVAFAGKRGHVAEFTPVKASALSTEAGSKSTHVRLARRGTPPSANTVDDEPGTVVQPNTDMQAYLRGQANR